MSSARFAPPTSKQARQVRKRQAPPPRQERPFRHQGDGRVITGGDGVRTRHGPMAPPHPGIGGRAFVLGPIAEIAPGWRHPATGKSATEMRAESGQGDMGAEVGDVDS